MKNVEKVKEKKRKIKKKLIDQSKKKQVLVIAQEIRLARLLSGNEKKTRDKVLKTLKKWLSSCFDKKYEFKEDDFIRVWKGLFYAVWMSDKPLVQEDLCESISCILDQFPEDQIKYAMLMTKAGFKMLATEWYGIDHHRMDKFLMLVRRYLRGSLRCLSRCKWNLQSYSLFANMLSNKDGLFAVNTPHYARNATSMLMHIVDCFLEELAKVSNGELPEDSLVELIRPFCTYMCGGSSPTLCTATRRLLTELVRQSDKGLEYQEAKRAWEQMGCPEGGPEALELVEDDDNEETMENGDEASDNDDESNRPLDPRAGRVDVFLPTLPVPASKIAAMLQDLLSKASSKAHKRVKICLQRFEKLARDEYPLRVEIPEEEMEPVVISAVKSAQELRDLEKKLISSSDELALRGLSRKHRKRLLAKTRAGLSIVDDVDKMDQKTSKVSTNGAWEVESTEPEPKKPKIDDTNKENQQQVKKLKKSLKKPQKINGDVPKAKTPKSIVSNKQIPKDISSKQVKDNKIQNKKEKVKKDKIDKPKDINTIIDDKISEHKNKINKHNIENKKLNGVKNNQKTLTVNKIKNFQKSTKTETNCDTKVFETPKRVKFVLKNNSMQKPVDYYKSVRQSPSIPFDSARKPSKTNLKPSTPSPINPFFKKKLKNKY